MTIKFKHLGVRWPGTSPVILSMILSVVLPIFLTVILFGGDASANNYLCSQFYNSNVNSQKSISLVDTIKKDLRENPNSFPAWVISEQLEKFLSETTSHFSRITAKIEERDQINLLDTSVKSGEAALASFYRIHKSLSAELNNAKNSANSNKKKINELADNLKSCLNTMESCRINLKQAVVDAHTELSQLNEFLANLQHKAEILNQFALQLPQLHEVPASLVPEITSLIESQLQILSAGLPRMIQSHIENQKNLISLAHTIIPGIVRANSEAAFLEASGAFNVGAISGLGRLTNPEITNRGSSEKAQVRQIHSRMNLPAQARKFEELASQSEPTPFGDSILTQAASKGIKIYPILSEANIAENSRISMADLKAITEALLANRAFVNDYDNFHSAYKLEGIQEIHPNGSLPIVQIGYLHLNLHEVVFNLNLLPFLLKEFNAEKFSLYTNWLNSQLVNLKKDLDAEIKKNVLTRWTPLYIGASLLSPESISMKKASSLIGAYLKSYNRDKDKMNIESMVISMRRMQPSERNVNFGSNLKFQIDIDPSEK
ncbi:MAG: hypothetical protein JNL11_09610 [Bdellovibrionaceae bacterium]|nr:hypothetical protein [Pseudobdellovibrionaceae bacterium]